MRRQIWAEMDDAARRDLFDRGLADIFDDGLRASIGELLLDVRDRGDVAVCEALARFDGIEIEPDGLRVTDDEIDAISDTELGDRPENAGDNWARNRKAVKAYKKKHGSV